MYHVILRNHLKWFEATVSADQSDQDISSRKRKNSRVPSKQSDQPQSCRKCIFRPNLVRYIVIFTCSLWHNSIKEIIAICLNGSAWWQKKKKSTYLWTRRTARDKRRELRDALQKSWRSKTRTKVGAVGQVICYAWQVRQIRWHI